MNSSSESSWDILQQPAHAMSGADARLLALLSALDQGWSVVEPIYLRPRWGEKGPWVYHLILEDSHHHQTRLLTVQAGVGIDSLVKVEGWKVNRSHD